MILVAEDDDVLREVLVESLQDEGFPVLAAAHAEQALTASDLELVITDVRMPGMDGLDLLARLRDHSPHLRSIIMTGYACDDAPVRALQLEAWDYLHKPFSLESFLRAVRRVLEADAERQRSRGWLAALGERLKRVVTQGQVHASDRLRDKAFAAFYLAVRARRLGVHEALPAWDRLEQLEREREALHPAGLADGYEEVLRQVSECHPHPVAERGPGQVSRVRFAEFYRRLERGDISAQQLALAPFLRPLEPRTLDESPELAALRQSMWGE